MILCLFSLCLRVLLSRVPTLLAIIFCTVYITPEFIMTMNGFVVKFCEILTFFLHAPMLVCFMILYLPMMLMIPSATLTLCFGR